MFIWTHSIFRYSTWLWQEFDFLPCSLYLVVNMDLTWLHNNIDLGDSSFAFFSSSILFNVDWGGSAIHIHGPDLWDNYSWDQLEMVILHLNMHSICHVIYLLMHILCLWRYLDAAGMKKSNAYLINGVVIVIAWLVGQVIAVWNILSLIYCVICGIIVNCISCWPYRNLILAILDMLTEMVFLQVARILLFVYMFYHVYLHFDQVITTDWI